MIYYDSLEFFPFFSILKKSSSISEKAIESLRAYAATTPSTQASELTWDPLPLHAAAKRAA